MSEETLTGEATCSGGHCVTCSDEATAMTVLCVDDARQLALCEDPARSRSTVEIVLVAPVAAGDRVLVHAGVAIATLAAEENAARRGEASPGAVLAS